MLALPGRSPLPMAFVPSRQQYRVRGAGLQTRLVRGQSDPTDQSDTRHAKRVRGRGVL